MIRLLIVLTAAASLAACATTSAENSLAISTFDYEPARSSDLPDSHFGYELVGEAGWAGQMTYANSGGEVAVDFVSNAGGDQQTAELAMEEPYLNGGVRRFTGSTEAGADIFVMLQAGPCAAGDHTYFATMVIGDVQYRGCASENAANDRWTNYLDDWMPAIDLCVTELRSQAEHVTYAYSTASGTAVRLADHNGNRWECVTIEDRRINAVRSLSAVDVILGEADPIFIRSEMPAQGDACYIYESVRTAEGTLIGAFGYDSCAGPRAPVS
ncbi:hypothetical protein [Hyphobacterium sp.]|uniref:hypothetical protein n=1 Tax=Hyphobacterium sp. TaxID=2004662 RepID=UPI003BAC1F64